MREIAPHSPGAVRILEDRGIDYCCGGQRSFGEACREKGSDWQAVALEIEAAGQSAEVDQPDWNTAPLCELIRHILAAHHEYLREELPRIADRLARVQIAHPQDAPVLTALSRVYGALQEELEGHLPKEERILFF